MSGQGVRGSEITSHFPKVTQAAYGRARVEQPEDKDKAINPLTPRFRIKVTAAGQILGRGSGDPSCV